MPDEISIPSELFQTILDTMTTALYFSQNADLADSYRTLEAEPVWSPLTERLVQVVTLLQAYTHIADEAAEEEAEDVPTPEQ